MSMHNIPLTDIEREGLKAHGLGRSIDKPSQLADCFRQGVKWGQDHERSRLHAENTALQSGYDAARLEIASLQAKLAATTGGQAQAVPNGWREQFATEVYADLEAADNQDVPLEEYPARILKVLDSTVGPRHPVVIKWRNDAIEQCIAIARKYCRDPESHKYLKQDLEAMLTAEPAPQVQADAADAARWHWLAEYLIGPRADLDNEIISCGSVAELGNVIDTALATQGV